MSIPKKELAMNAVNWLKDFKEAKRRGQINRHLGTILIYFDETDMTESAVCVASINHDGIKDACKAILKKLERDSSRIIKPGDWN